MYFSCLKVLAILVNTLTLVHSQVFICLHFFIDLSVNDDWVNNNNNYLLGLGGVHNFFMFQFQKVLTMSLYSPPCPFLIHATLTVSSEYF